VSSKERDIIPLISILIFLIAVPLVRGEVSARIAGSTVSVTWRGSSGHILRTNLDTHPIVRVGYGQVDVFQKHSTYDLNVSTEHIARTITIQNRESGDQGVRCGNWTITENSTAMFQCRWDFNTVSQTRATWNGQIWVTIFDGLPRIFIGLRMTASEPKGEEENSEWILQIEARDGIFDRDGSLEATNYGTRENFGWQFDTFDGNLGHVLMTYGRPSALSVPSDPWGWRGIVPGSRYLKAYKSRDGFAEDGESVVVTAIYEFVEDLDPQSFAENLQYLVSGEEDLTLNNSRALIGKWLGWDYLRAAYAVKASEDEAKIALSGHEGILYEPALLVENIRSEGTIDVLNGSVKLVEGKDYTLHRDPKRRMCYVLVRRMSGFPQNITVKKGIDVTPPRIIDPKRSLKTVWNHTRVRLSARISDISGVKRVTIWHNGTGVLSQHTQGICNNSGLYSFWLDPGNYSFGDTIEWFFQAQDSSPRGNVGNGSKQTFFVPKYRRLDVGGIYLCGPDGLALGQDYGHENYQQKFKNMLRGQGVPFTFYTGGNISLQKLEGYPYLVIGSQMIQDSAWDYRQYLEENTTVGKVLREYLEHECGDIVFIDPAALWQIRGLLGIRGDYAEMYGYNQGLSADRVDVCVVHAIPGVTPREGTNVSQVDGDVGTDNHLGEGWFLLDTNNGSWGNPKVFVNITVAVGNQRYWIPLGYWKVNRSKIWLTLPKWTTRGLDLVGEPHDGKTGWLFKIVEYAMQTAGGNISAKIMPFMTRHSGVSYSLNGLRPYMTVEEQSRWIQTLEGIAKIRKETGSPVSLYIGAIPLHSPLRPSLIDQGEYFWEDYCYNDTGIERNSHLMTGLDGNYSKWFTGGNNEYNAMGTNWILNGTRKFIMLYNNTPSGPFHFKIDTDGDLDFSEEKEYTMYEDGWMKLNISGKVVNITVRGILWERQKDMGWTLLVMDSIENQVDTRLFDYINSHDWIRVGIHYPWMGVKRHGSHWGRSIDETDMWPESDLYSNSRRYFEDSLSALKRIIDPDQVEPVFSPSEHTISRKYMRGFRDAGMTVHLSNWQALFGPERYECENESQFFYNMYRGQEDGWGPGNWMAIVNLSGITARNLGIDIDQGGTSYYDAADDDMMWMKDHGWLADYSDRSVEVVSIMDAWRFWNSTLHMLLHDSQAFSNGSCLWIRFKGSREMQKLTWAFPRRNASGSLWQEAYFDGRRVLPNLTDQKYTYLTLESPEGTHEVALRYGRSLPSEPPFDNDPGDINYTIQTTGHTIRWVVSDRVDPSGQYVLELNSSQIGFGRWINGTALKISCDHLPLGTHSFRLVYWDSKSPKLEDEVLVTVTPVGEHGPIIGLVAVLVLLHVLQASVRRPKSLAIRDTRPIRLWRS